jgi:hypothetical protein
LIAEIGNLKADDDLAPWAHRRLPAKNTLVADDTRAVEAAYQAVLDGRYRQPRRWKDRSATVVTKPTSKDCGQISPKGWPQLFGAFAQRRLAGKHWLPLALGRSIAPVRSAYFRSGNGALVRSFLLAMMAADERSR